MSTPMDPSTGLSFFELMDMSSDGLIALSLEGDIVAWNASAQHLFGYRRDDVVGRRFETLAPGSQGDDTRSALARALKEGTSSARVAWPRPDGTSVELDVSMRCIPANGAPGFIALRGSQAPSNTPPSLESLDPQLAGLLETAPDAMVLVDSRGEIKVVNHQA